MSSCYIPIVDTHCHLGGSFDPQFIWKIIEANRWWFLAESLDQVLAQYTFKNDSNYNFHHFLSKFMILDEIKWTEQLLDDSIASLCTYYRNNNPTVDHLWLDFSINKYMDIGWSKWQAIKFIRQCFNHYWPDGVDLILSIKYESLRHTQNQYLKLIDEPRAMDSIIGIDLVGDEGEFDAKFYGQYLRAWRRAGKMVRAHVGETGPVANILAAIIDLQVTNIAHGLKLVDHPEAVATAASYGVCFDLAIIGNYITGVWADRVKHPLTTMLNHNIPVTLGTDDPSVFNNTFLCEIECAQSLGATAGHVQEMRSRAYANWLKFHS